VNGYLTLLSKRENGKIKGIDIGFQNLIATSDREFFGNDVSKIAEKITRKRVKSKRWKKKQPEK
jgi:transposase